MLHILRNKSHHGPGEVLPRVMRLAVYGLTNLPGTKMRIKLLHSA